MTTESRYRRSPFQGDGLYASCSADPPLCPHIQVAKAHFGDSAGMAEKASAPHFPYFIYGPLESIICECHGLAHL